MSQFCTSCGAPNSGAAFCTSCGTSLATGNPQPAAFAASQTSEPAPSVGMAPSPNISTPKQKGSTKRKALLSLLAFVVVGGGSAGGFFAGKASIDLENERSVAFDEGYQEGNLNGFNNGEDSGYNEGFREGKTAGCNAAYSFYDGNWDHIVPYDTYLRRMTGGYYNSRTDCD